MNDREGLINEIRLPNQDNEVENQGFKWNWGSCGYIQVGGNPKMTTLWKNNK